jgi:hypothetical protein
VSVNEHRKATAEKRRGMVRGLTDRLLDLIEDSGATEEEALAALKTAKITLPLLRLESSRVRYVGGEG